MSSSVGIPRLRLDEVAFDVDRRPDFDTRITAILPGRLYLGDKRGASDLGLLKQHRITHVLNMTPDAPFADDEQFECLRIPLEDGSEHLREVLDQAHAFIERGERVFVHCRHGISRSASVVISYLMRENGLNYSEALAEVRKARPMVNPHFFFEVALMGS